MTVCERAELHLAGTFDGVAVRASSDRTRSGIHARIVGSKIGRAIDPATNSRPSGAAIAGLPHESTTARSENDIEPPAIAGRLGYALRRKMPLTG
jgi:hypothetical protein